MAARSAPSAAPSSILVAVDLDGIATVTLNRPEIHNAFDDVMIAELTHALRDLDADPQVRVVILAANGSSFSAGANLNWMKRMAGYSEAQNVKDALGLAGLMHTLYTLGKPTIARVQGPAFAGGMGLVACCDIAIATRQATFCLTEVRLGLIPAVITPYVIAAIGERQARRYCLTAEKFDAAEAFRLGLIHDLVEEHELGSTLNSLVTHLFLGGPQALAQCKDWISVAAASPIDDRLVAESARRIAALRAGSEGREGVAAFLEKRDSRWVAEAKRRIAERESGPAVQGKGAARKAAPKKASPKTAPAKRAAPARRR
ncbi:MAG: enoyl-CoA hydratase/isomerase family protein [Burkholderiales bacterium]|nr:enoyl-CoA hydratase/isomerase family protein [Burkholderiales bacterium]